MTRNILVLVFSAIILAAVPTWWVLSPEHRRDSPHASLTEASQQFQRRVADLRAEDTRTLASLERVQEDLGELRRSLAAMTYARLRRSEPDLSSVKSHVMALESEAAHAMQELEFRVRESLLTTSRLAQTALSEAHAARELARMRDTVEEDESERLSTMHAAMVSPIVQLSGGGSVGSGMVLATVLDEEAGRRDAYVLTSFHVIRNILAGSTADRPAEISTTIYRASGRRQHSSDLLEFDEELDLALLRVRAVGEDLPRVRFATEDEERATRVFTPIYTVGCPLGADPIPTRGEILRKDHELDGQDYWMISSPAYFGNSGGGVYLESSRRLIGIFSKIYTYGRTNPVVIPHMGLLTPTSVLRRWLADHGHGHIALEVAPDTVCVPTTAEAR